MKKIFVRSLWVFFFVLVITGAGAFYAIWNGKIGYMPPVENLQNPISRYASQVYSADGKILGTWNFSKENRICVNYDDLSPQLVNALIATEDSRFYSHSGIDFRALTRAIIKRGLLGQKNAGGGSTITQQLAKQLYSETASSTMERMFQKPIEWVIAIKLERYYSKEQIITLYLNYFDFLNNAVGIKNAANTYFNKEPKDLTLDEAATLVGMCKNPSYFNPVRHNERCRERRNMVLHQMYKAEYITEEEFEEHKTHELKLNFHRRDHKEGRATYFRDFLRLYLTAKKPDPRNYIYGNDNQYYIDSLAWENDPLYGWCNKNKNKDGNPYNIYTDGLKVYTTIDSRMQKYAEEAVYDHVAKFLQPAFDKEKRHKSNFPYSHNLTHEQVDNIIWRSIRQSERYRLMKKDGASKEEIISAFNTPVEMTVFSYKGNIDTLMSPKDSIRYYKGFLRSGFMSMEPVTGAVRAYVGGLDFSHFQYDMVTAGRRQVGSTIKPFLYSLAMENGMTPCDETVNEQRTYNVPGSGPWTPRNAGHARIGEIVTLKWGLANSNNWISAYVMSKLNPADFVYMLRQFGIGDRNIHPSPALCLGPCEATVAEMVSAYTTFANYGIHTLPLFVTKIADSEGNVLAEFQPRMNEVISEKSAYEMIYMLRAVVDGGTAGRVRWRYKIEGEIGAKTGTTNNNSDGWFMGFTPQLVSGCWVGGEDRDIHFGGMAMGQGATMALPIWAAYMKKVYADKSLPYSSEAKFKMPEDFDPCTGQSTHHNDSTAVDKDEFEQVTD